jgi:NitT/TauT family transport system permease protein
MRDVDKDLVNVLKVSGANSWHLFSMVIAPTAAPWIFAGMRISIRYAFTAVIFGEMMSGNRGLGYLVKYSANMFNASGVFAALSVVMVIGVILTITLQRVERFSNRWRT